MTPGMKRLAAFMLEKASKSDEFDGTSDLDLVADAGMMKSEADEFSRAYDAWNDHLGEFEPGRPVPDFGVMDFLAATLRMEAVCDDTGIKGEKEAKTRKKKRITK